MFCYRVACFVILPSGSLVWLQDGVYLISLYPDLIRDYKKAILTPNVVEYARLYEATVSDSSVYFFARLTALISRFPKTHNLIIYFV